MILLLLACSKTVAAPEPGPEASLKKTAPEINLDLFAWLDAKAGKSRLELPLELDREGLGLAAKVVGNGQALPLELDSTALSMTLSDHLHSHCPSYPCRVWVAGSWGSLLPSPTPSGPTFTVHSVVGPIEGEPVSIRLR